MRLRDHLGVPILPSDTLVITAWGGSCPAYLVGSQATLTGETRRGFARIDVNGRALSVDPCTLGVVNRQTGHGWEGNR